MKTALDIWPAFPIVIDANFGNYAVDIGIVGALEDRGRIVGISLGRLTQSTVEKWLRVLQQPFPVLTSLDLSIEYGKVAHVNTDVFLGGSIPRLKRVSLRGIRFSALPTLLSSACGLVDLHLGYFPVTGMGHISPEAMTTFLSSLTRLQSFSISFLSHPESTHPMSQRPPPSTLAPTALPALTNLSLEGPHEYLEDLLTRINTPLLEDGNLQFYDAPNFDTPQVSQFIHRTGMFNLPSEVDVYIRKAVSFQFLSSIGLEKKFGMSFSGSDTDLYTEVELMEQLCTRCPPLLSHIERLQLVGGDVEYWYKSPLSAPWLEFLQPFIAVKTLHLSGSVIMPHVSRTLGELAEERAPEVLPVLHTLVLSWSREVVFEAARLVGPFIVARKHSEHPVVVKRTSPWKGLDSSDAE